MTCYNEAVVIYKGRDNAVTVIPYADLTADVNYDMTAVTRVLTNADVEGDEIVGNSVIGDSDFDPLLVYWNDDTIVGSTPQWRIYCKVGLYDTGTIPAGTYTLRITIFDPTHPNGLVLPDTESALLVTIVDLP
jgi:hypothetical protein